MVPSVPFDRKKEKKVVDRDGSLVVDQDGSFSLSQLELRSWGGFYVVLSLVTMIDKEWYYYLLLLLLNVLS